MHCVQKGRIVHYVHKVDTDPSETPNVSAALVVKVHEGNKVDLHCFHQTGSFVEHQVNPSEDHTERGSWHWPKHDMDAEAPAAQ